MAGICERCGRAGGTVALDGGIECVEGCGHVTLDEPAGRVPHIVDEGAAEAHARGRQRIADLRRRRDTPEPPGA